MTGVACRACATDELGPALLAQVMDLCVACWPDGDFTPEDLGHTLGGRHFLAEADGRVVAHAAVVPRLLEVGGRPLRTGYVEAVATLPRFRRRGLASRLMLAAGEHLATAYQMGALSTGEPGWYGRLGWQRWQGETWVREPDGTLTRTEDDDDGVMVLRTPSTPRLTLGDSICCPRRPGDAW